MSLLVRRPGTLQRCARFGLALGTLLVARSVECRAAATWFALLLSRPTTLLALASPTHAASSRPPAPTPSDATSNALQTRIAYEFDAQLDATNHLVTAAGTIHWTNGSSRPQQELWFHLYLNAFLADSTVFMRAPQQARRSAVPLRRPGGIDVFYLRAREFGGMDLWEKADRNSPGDPNDATDIRVPLPRAVPPGAVLTLDVSFRATLPELVERSGFSGDFHMVAQWFPKLARLEGDGSWSHFSYHPQAEFYADFADYRIALDVPDEYVVGATGRLVRSEPGGPRRVEHYEVANVHDFAWAAWPHFQSLRYRVDGVDILQLSPPGYARAQEATRKVIESALPEFSAKYGAYPYSGLTVVHPPSTATPACGMEYPTLITTGGPWFASYIGMRSVEAVTAHELAHQWFYGIIASNEYRWPFLDEGLSSFAEMRALEPRSDAGELPPIGAFRISRLAEFRAMAAEAPSGSSAQPAVDFAGFAELGALAYARPALALETLARVYGRARLDRALAGYAKQKRFGHATPADLVAQLRLHLGVEAAQVFEQAIIQGAGVDFRVERIEHVRLPGSNVVLSRILLGRAGSLVLPVQVQLTDAGGRKHLLRWHTSEPSQWLEFRGPSRVVSAVIDPDSQVLLDRELLNNARSISPSPLLGTQGLVNILAQLALQGFSL